MMVLVTKDLAILYALNLVACALIMWSFVIRIFGSELFK